MRVKVRSLTEEEAKVMLAARLRASMERRKRVEVRWRQIESLLFNFGAGPLTPTLSYDSPFQAAAINSGGDVDEEDAATQVHVPQVIRNVRILHSQLTANPPMALATPLSNEADDEGAATVANHLINHGEEAYGVRIKVGALTFNAQTYGTGYIKVGWDGTKGRVLKYHKDTEEVEMEGDTSIDAPNVWNIYLDGNADSRENIGHMFERIQLPFHEAMAIWPDKADALTSAIIQRDGETSWDGTVTGSLESANIRNTKENDVVNIFIYYEKAAPINGMAGRSCVHLLDGTLITNMEKLDTPDGDFPIDILTDMDTPGDPYGISTVDFAVELSKIVDDLDTMILDNIDLHGNLHLVVFDGSDINESDLAGTPVKVVRVNGAANEAPMYLSAPPLNADIYRLRESKVAEIDAVMSVNEALQGQIPRELSGYAVQTAMDAANLPRMWFYTKYKLVIGNMWKKYLGIARENWKTAKKVNIVGSEDESQVKYYKGSDLKGGYAIKTTYGEMFSLDPNQRRQQILQIEPILTKAGADPKEIAKQVQYTEMDSIYDSMEVAKKRQLEIFDKMIDSWDKVEGSVKYIPANEMELAFHAEMAEAGYRYVMQKKFLNLPKPVKSAIYKHIKEREGLAAAQAAPPPPKAGAGMETEGDIPEIPGMPTTPPSPEEAMPDLGEVL